ncbi:MAG: hypothetical protein M3R65_06065 [Gemmatimonadota bacterium]|nr:hypothetical protein [Gemmatimonadota bacterium]
MLSTFRLLLAAYFGLGAAIVVWNIAVASRILEVRRSASLSSIATGLGALLLVPGLVIAISDASLVYGRAIQTVAWIWPLVAILFVVQALVALSQSRVGAMLGVPILTYDLVIAMVAVARYMNQLGYTPPYFSLVLSAAQCDALGVVAGSAALSRATWLLVPMFAPALPSRSRVRITFRYALALGVTVATALVLVELPGASEAISSYTRYEQDVLTTRSGDFQFALKVLPDLRSSPPPVAVKNDFSFSDSVGVDGLLIVVDPEAARGKALDSLVRSLDIVRDDSTVLIVTLGYARNARADLNRSPNAFIEDRLADVNRLARALRPNIMVPAYEPYGEGARALGVRVPEFWMDFIQRAAGIIHHVNPNIRVAVAAASFGARDSVVYQWAASRSSPVDVVGFSLMPGFDGATSLDTHMRIAQRWLRATSRPKPHWVLAAGGYPVAHGERSQLLALRGVLSWATAQPAIRGVVFTDAGDYDAQRGLRAPDGRFRPALGELERSISALRESGTQ